MTPENYAVLALVALAAYLNRARFLPATAPVRPAPAPNPTVTYVGTTGDPTAIAAQLHQAVTAQAQGLALSRSVTAMVEDHSKRVQFPWTAATTPEPEAPAAPKS